MVLDMQARLLLDMLGKGIESALLNPSALVQEPWHASGETLSSIDPEAMAVDPALVLSIQVCLFWPFFFTFCFYRIFFFRKFRVHGIDTYNFGFIYGANT